MSENKPVRSFEASETFLKKWLKFCIYRIMSKINFIRTLVFKTWKWSQREFETSLILFLVFIQKWIQRSGGNLTSWSLANSSPHWESVYNALKAYRASWNSGELLVFRKEKNMSKTFTSLTNLLSGDQLMKEPGRSPDTLSTLVLKWNFSHVTFSSWTI